MEEAIKTDQGGENDTTGNGNPVIYEWGSYEDVSPLRVEEETN